MEKEYNDTIVVGKKEFLAYIRSADLLMRKEGLKKIVLKARGKNINRAVDIAEALKNKFLKDLKVKIGNIETDTGYINNEGREKPISSIKIEIKRI